MRPKTFHTKSRSWGGPDFLILAPLFLLLVFGMIALSSASSNLGQKNFNDSYYYLKHQLLYGAAIGMLGLLAAYVIPYHRYERISLAALILSFFLLILVFTPIGFSAGGASRWLQFGEITIQPAEILKITLVLYLAAWLSKQKERRKHAVRGLIPFLTILLIIALLLVKQPATSTLAILLFVAGAMYFASGAPWKYIILLGIIAVLGIALLIYFTPYRLERFLTFLDPEADPRSAGYQLYQTLLSVGSGGLTGVGYGESVAKTYYLPEPIGDSIFAVIAAEFGFLGSLLLIIAFGTLVFRALVISRRCDDSFGKLILLGFGTLIGIQTFVNIAAVSGLIPLTGTPLPFISYGSSGLIAYMIIAGILLNVSRYARK